ncbi:MAG: MoaD/ThiS family protein, partial [Bacteroidota bacterium]
MAKLLIPTPLRKFTENQASLEVEAGNVENSIKELATRFPEVKRHILDQDGNIRTFVRLFVGDEDINALDGPATAVEAGRVISIIP